MKIFIAIKRAVVGGAVVACGIGLVVGGACDSAGSGPQASDVGAVSLALALPSGATVGKVHYVLLQQKDPAKPPVQVQGQSGDIVLQTTGGAVLAAAPSVALGAPVGSAYTVALMATTSDGRMCSGTSDPFSITANQVSKVTVNVSCASSTGGTFGGVSVKGVLDNCPSIVAAAASSLVVMAGGTIDLSATAVDVDVGDAVTYSWKADGGTFDRSDTATTKYHCPTAAGLQTITLEVADHTGAATGGGRAGGGGGAGGASDAPTIIPTGPAMCKTSSQVVVNCGLCGNGVLDSSGGEQCDPPDGTTCDSVCQTIAVPAGAGGVGAGGRGGSVGGAGGVGG